MKKYLLLLFILFTACEHQGDMPFESRLWKEAGPAGYPPPYRKKMLYDLLTRQPLKGQNYTAMVIMLGVPDSRVKGSVTYNIIVEYGADRKAVYVNYLTINLSKDSLVHDFIVKEYKREKK